MSSYCWGPFAVLLRAWMGVWLQLCGPVYWGAVAFQIVTSHGARSYLRPLSKYHWAICPLVKDKFSQWHSHRALLVSSHQFCPFAKCLLSSAGRACAS